MKPLTAIVADDEDLIRASVVRHLERLWPELIITGQARNGPEALALLERTTPDIAFLDIRMPGMTGQMVIRLADTDREIPVSRAYTHLFKAM